MIEAIAALILIAALYAALRYSFFFTRVHGLPVLMFHKVSKAERDFLTVTENDFTQQLKWLGEQGYQSITMQQFLDFTAARISRDSLPAKPCLLTFDDGYENNVSLALPILKKMQWTACLFVTSSYIAQGEVDRSSGYLNVEQLRDWVKQGMELGLHSHNHPNYRQIEVAAVLADLELNRQYLKSHQLTYTETLAYPFGARPKDSAKLAELKQALKSVGVEAAFRIGNRIHSFKELARGIDRMDVCRIDVRGDDPFFEFKIKVLKGRSKRF